jgi:hypothetical protein
MKEGGYLAKGKVISKLSDLTPDARNANKGTERGNSRIERSLRQYGAGRSILIDKKGRIIAGNKTVENAAAIGLEEVTVVQTDGKRIIAVQRTDLGPARKPSAVPGPARGPPASRDETPLSSPSAAHPDRDVAWRARKPSLMWAVCALCAIIVGWNLRDSWKNPFCSQLLD